ncbi:MAG: MFS transporter [Bacteroidetes bacterium 43-93]|nr:MFS transporter [Bacteroidota bacterium]OJW96802.1 MAG: MFS transporter [Bacteroidetes bacterium 43-93]
MQTDIIAKKRLYRAWSMYDWANSAYNLVITSTIYPTYYLAVTTTEKNGATSDIVDFFGIKITNSVLFSYSLALAYLLIAILSPILSSIADYKGTKKSFMKLFCYVGSLACCGLFFFTGDHVELGVILSAVAAAAFYGSLVFYNSFLPEIAPEEDRDKLSAQGFAYGYIGSVLLQLICFVFVLNPDTFSITVGMASRISFLLVGIWWIGWAQIPFARLPKGRPLEQHPEHNILSNGFHELRKVWKQVRSLPVLSIYLLAFFLYSMGVQTVMVAATIFGDKVLKLSTPQLITTILIIQLVAIAGAYIMSKLSERFGNLTVLICVVFIWVGVCIGAYYTTTAMQFYIIATVVGLIMGGIQSLSRSTYSKLMPETRDTTSFFSFYDVTEKIALVIGIFSFGYIDSLTGSMRNSVLALITFFAAGMIVLYLAIVKAKKEHLKSTVI